MAVTILAGTGLGTPGISSELPGREACLSPFAEPILDLLTDLSHQLLSPEHRADMPELAPLGFFLRKAALRKLEERTLAGVDLARTSLMARGVVLHVPPANVDTVFLYSLTLSLLCGNVNGVKLSSRIGPVGQRITQILSEVIADPCHSEVAPLVTVFRCDHEEPYFDSWALAADLRVFWGGDHSVSSLRSLPCAPWAQDLPFPDRRSLAAIATKPYLDLSRDNRIQLAAKFYNDSYWFDQRACSSPQLIAWVGGTRAEMADASGDLLGRLANEAVEHEYATGASLAMSKMVDAARIVANGGTTVDWASNEAVSVQLGLGTAAAGDVSGGGFFQQVHLASLGELAAYVDVRVQTLTYFGLERSELRDFISQIKSLGIDRIVPVGRALDFDSIWDGHDLTRDFTRLVTID